MACDGKCACGGKAPRIRPAHVLETLAFHVLLLGFDDESIGREERVKEMNALAGDDELWLKLHSAGVNHVILEF